MPHSHGVRWACALLLGLCLLHGPAGAQSIFTIAGGGSSDNRPATSVGLRTPVGIAAAQDGTLFIAEEQANRVRRVDPSTGLITTYAGDGAEGFKGDDGPATRASLWAPRSLDTDSAGNLYIGEFVNFRVRRVDVATGMITTIAGNGYPGYSGDGGPATQAMLDLVTGVAVDGGGNVYIACSLDDRVRRVAAETGIISTIVGNGQAGYSGDGGPATAAMVRSPNTIAVDRQGNVFVADTGNNRVRRIDATTGVITTVAGNGSTTFSGDGGPATAAGLSGPWALACDAEQNLYISEGFIGGGTRIRRVDHSTGVIRTIAGTGLLFVDGDRGPATAASFWATSIDFDAYGNIYLGCGHQYRVRKIDGGSGIISTAAGNGFASSPADGGPATAADLDAWGLTIDSDGAILIADRVNDRVQSVDPVRGTITTIAGTGGYGSSGDGGPATAATFAGPSAVVVDPAGNIVIADEMNNRIRRVDKATGVIRTIADLRTIGPSYADYDLAIDAAGNVFVSCADCHVVVRIDGASLAMKLYAGNGTGPGLTGGSFSGDGGPATAAGLRVPQGIAVDREGNLFIADEFNYRVRKVDGQTGIITTVAGGSTGYEAGDGGPATAAYLSLPSHVAFDRDGNLLIAQLGGIRRVDAATQIITTVAGNGVDTVTAGDGGRALDAGIASADGLTTDSRGNFYVSESRRVRAVLACVDVGVPALVSPSDASSGSATSLPLVWQPVAGAFRYDVYLDTANPPARIIAGDLTSAVYSLANLEPLTAYYWRVVAKGDPFCEPPSAASSRVWSFTTTSTCGLPGEFSGNSIN